IIASNNEWPIPLDPDDRRFMVLDTWDKFKQNDEYFGPLRAELYEGGGHAAMLYDLLNHQVNKAWLRHPINTLAKIDVMTRSLPPSERWWLEKLETGVLADG